MLMGIIAEHIYGHLDRNGLLPDEQKGCRRKTQGTKDQLLIDKMVLKNCRRRHTNLNMAVLGTSRILRRVLDSD